MAEPAPDAVDAAYLRAVGEQTDLGFRVGAALAELDALIGQHEQYRTPWTDDYDVCTACTRGMELVPWPCATRQIASRIRTTLTGGDHHDR